MTINLSEYLYKEVTVTLRNRQTLTGTIESSLAKISPLIYSKYPYFMDAKLDAILTWTNTGRWDNTESQYDIMSIVENTQKQMTTKLVYDVGTNDLTGLSNGKIYRSWHHMLETCYSPLAHIRKPCYIGCTVSEEWHLLSNYKKWYEENYVEGWCCGKSLLFPRNRIYSAETCLFVPKAINTLFTFRTKLRELPVGVFLDNNPSPQQVNLYRADCNNGHGDIMRKFFGNSTDAHFWYLDKKITVIDSYLIEDYNEKIKQGLTNWRFLLQEHINNRVEFVP
jgi:hypothetical protein